MTIMFKGFVFASFADVFAVASNIRVATTTTEVTTMINVITLKALILNEDQLVRLESAVIPMFDSGTVTEEVGMAMMECKTYTELRNIAYRGLEFEAAQDLCEFVFDGSPEVDLDLGIGCDVDLSEYFECKTPEEARCLQSWAEAFGAEVTIKPNLVVVNNAHWDDLTF